MKVGCKTKHENQINKNFNNKASNILFELFRDIRIIGEKHE